MDRRSRLLFLLLVAAQAAHSTEEYFTRLFDRLAPARAVSEAIGLDRATGFLIANAALAGFGLWCYLARVRSGRGAARGFAWFWAVLETANGLGHVGLAIAAGGYFPGLATAPLLFALGLRLAWSLASRRRYRPPA
jgi:Protein of unknown function with HXXEE motif